MSIGYRKNFTGILIISTSTVLLYIQFTTCIKHIHTEDYSEHKIQQEQIKTRGLTKILQERTLQRYFIKNEWAYVRVLTVCRPEFF